MSPPLTLLFLTSEFKGHAALREAKHLGCRTLLLAHQKDQHAEWPRESLDEVFFMPTLLNVRDVIHSVSYLARTRLIDYIFPLDDFEVVTAAELREHFRMPGLSASLARHFRDKLAMRQVAHDGGLRVPEFCGVFNHQRLREFMTRTPGPWLLKPRGEASSAGIRRINAPEELWPQLEALGDEQSFFLLEQYLPGDVFHVDSLVNDGDVIFSVASQYGRPPLDVYHGGGVFHSRSLDRAAPETAALLDFNRQLLKVLGLPRGATHAEFIRARADGQFYFLECAARVGGANISDAIEFGAGLNLWAEWVKIELAHLRGETYHLPETRTDYFAVMNCLAQQEWPDLDRYQDFEVVWRLVKPYHAGLILVTPDPARLMHLIDTYTDRFSRDFLAVMPARETLRE
jgi:biotin carboxylase